MKTKQSIFAPVIAALLFATANSFAAAQTYHGTLTGGTFYCGTDQVAGPFVTGTWNLSIDPATPAQLTLTVFYNGRQHLAWGYNALILDPSRSGGGIYVFSGFGGMATATLNTNDATFSWHVELPVTCPTQYPYDSLTFFGVVSH